MRAEVTKKFRGCRDGQLHPRDIMPGEVIDGDLAQAAINGGFAKRAVIGAPHNKALGGAPDSKFREPAPVEAVDDSDSGQRSKPAPGRPGKGKKSTRPRAGRK